MPEQHGHRLLFSILVRGYKLKQHIIAGAVLALGVAGCAGASTTTTPAQSAHATEAVAKKNLQTAIERYGPKISPTATLYKVDEIAIQDGSTYAAFVSSSKVTREASGLTVVDADSGQTFHFSANATVETKIGAGRVIVERGQRVPAFARAANAQISRTRSVIE